MIRADDLDSEEEHLNALRRTGFWGRMGAGCVVYAVSTGRILIAQRSDEVLEPGTWGTWGGAVDPGEDLAAAVIRELVEEAGFDPGAALDVHRSFLFSDPASGFSYQNFIVVVSDEFAPVLNWESCDHAWVRPDELPDDLHPGLQAFLSSGVARAQLADLERADDGPLDDGPGRGML